MRIDQLGPGRQRTLRLRSAQPRISMSSRPRKCGVHPKGHDQNKVGAELERASRGTQAQSGIRALLPHVRSPVLFPNQEIEFGQILDSTFVDSELIVRQRTSHPYSHIDELGPFAGASWRTILLFSHPE